VQTQRSHVACLFSTLGECYCFSRIFGCKSRYILKEGHNASSDLDSDLSCN